MIHVLSISGGKDSAAMWSWAKRTGLAPRVAVACDTGWEASFGGVDWTMHINALAAAIGEPVRVVRGPETFAERVIRSGTFPGRINRRWCTEELKLKPFRAEVDRIREEFQDDVEVYVGVRAEESQKRAKMTPREWSDFYDCYVSRPILDWSVEQVLREHTNHGLPLHPLYRRGADRVGCWPCIKAGKKEIRLVSELDPERIEEIRGLEEVTGTTMFALEASRAGGAPRHLVPTPIDDVIRWSKTERGGRKLRLLPVEGGCARWGICDAPADDDEGEGGEGER